MKPRRGLAESAQNSENNSPMMAIFGGAFGLMLVFLLLVNLFSSAAVRERLESTAEQGLYKIQRLDGGSGHVVIIFPGLLRVVETGASIVRGQICNPDSAFIEYARRIYAQPNQQLLFFILEGSVLTMSEARNCLRELWAGQTITIGWVIADNEFLKSVSLDDIPSYIREYAEQQ